MSQMAKPRRVVKKEKPRLRGIPPAREKPRLKARTKTKEELEAERIARWNAARGNARRGHCDWCDRDDRPIMCLVVDQSDDPRVWGFWQCYDCCALEIEREAVAPKRHDRIDTVTARLRWALMGRKSPREVKAAMAKVRAACWSGDDELTRWETKLKGD